MSRQLFTPTAVLAVARPAGPARSLAACVVAVLALAVGGTAAAATPIDPPRPPAATPDLGFSAATTKGFTLRNNPCGFTIHPCRGGPAGSVLVRVSWDAGPFGQRTSWLFLSSLADGASITIDYAAIGLEPFDPSRPCGTLSVLADPGNSIVERNELNNTRSVTVGPFLDCV